MNTILLHCILLLIYQYLYDPPTSTMLWAIRLGLITDVNWIPLSKNDHNSHGHVLQRRSRNPVCTAPLLRESTSLLDTQPINSRTEAQLSPTVVHWQTRLSDWINSRNGPCQIAGAFHCVLYLQGASNQNYRPDKHGSKLREGALLRGLLASLHCWKTTSIFSTWVLQQSRRCLALERCLQKPVRSVETNKTLHTLFLSSVFTSCEYNLCTHYQATSELCGLAYTLGFLNLKSSSYRHAANRALRSYAIYNESDLAARKKGPDYSESLPRTFK